MIRFLKYIVQKHNQINIPNLLNGWQATAGFIGKWFKKAFFVNKNVHFYFRNRYIYTHYFFFIQHIVKWLSNLGKYVWVWQCIYIHIYIYIDTYTLSYPDIFSYHFHPISMGSQILRTNIHRIWLSKDLRPDWKVHFFKPI